MQRDPEAIERAYLHKMAPVDDACVLEIGCGDGRLTWRYAAMARQVVGIDPKGEQLTAAWHNCPSALRTRVAFVQATAEVLPLRDEIFDGTVLAWSL
jgi:ubiquinone/menaquinone biosynthesis C-methylase UbiE